MNTPQNRKQNTLKITSLSESKPPMALFLGTRMIGLFLFSVLAFIPVFIGNLIMGWFFSFPEVLLLSCIPGVLMLFFGSVSLSFTTSGGFGFAGVKETWSQGGLFRLYRRKRIN